jgi:hypothetical protein
VNNLGLKSTLTEYNVPREDAPEIAGLALGGNDRPEYAKVVRILEGLY